MKKKQKVSSVESFVYLKVFLFVLGIALSISLSVRFLTYMRESTYHGTHFVLLVVSSQRWYLVEPDKSLRTVSILEIKNPPFIHPIVREKASFALGIPIDGILIYRGKSEFSEFPKQFFLIRNVFDIVFGRAHTLTGLNKLDVVNIYSVARFATHVKFRSLSWSKTDAQNKGELDRVVYDMLSDEVLKNQKVSIEVVNASGVDGAGRQVARVLNNVGFNVVSVISSEQDLPSHTIFRVQKNYTVERLLSIFHFPASFVSETALADVTVVVGREYAEKYMVD